LGYNKQIPLKWEALIHRNCQPAVEPDDDYKLGDVRFTQTQNWLTRGPAEHIERYPSNRDIFLWWPMNNGFSDDACW